MADPAVNNDQYEFSSAAPLAHSGLDLDKLLSGDPDEQDKARAAGLSIPGMPSAKDEAQMAPFKSFGSGAGMNTPSPSGTASNQPQEKPGPSGINGMGDGLAAAHAPGEKTATPVVPGTVTRSGDPDDENEATIQRASQMAEQYSKRLQDAPTLTEEEKAIEARRTLPPQEFDPAHPEYRPSAGRRILRGLVGVGEGVARGGIFGGVLGGLDPAAVGATPYGAPTRQFSMAAQRQAAESAALDRQKAATEKGYTDDTNRAKDVITSINDIGRNAAAAITARSRQDVADARQQSADVQSQLADIKQQVADYQEKNQIPKTYEATVTAAYLEQDPKKRASLMSAAKDMAAQKIREAAARHAATGQPNTFRQSMIDAATAEIQALQDKYQYDPRDNQYHNPDSINDVLTPQEYTDKKNLISTKLDKQLEQKKMQPLRVRFDPADAGGNKPSGRAARRAAQNPQPQAQTSKPKHPAPDNTRIQMEDGSFQVKRNGKWVPEG